MRSMHFTNNATSKLRTAGTDTWRPQMSALVLSPTRPPSRAVQRFEPKVTRPTRCRAPASAGNGTRIRKKDDRCCKMMQRVGFVLPTCNHKLLFLSLQSSGAFKSWNQSRLLGSALRQSTSVRQYLTQIDRQPTKCKNTGPSTEHGKSRRGEMASAMAHGRNGY